MAGSRLTLYGTSVSNSIMEDDLLAHPPATPDTFADTISSNESELELQVKVYLYYLPQGVVFKIVPVGLGKSFVRISEIYPNDIHPLTQMIKELKKGITAYFINPTISHDVSIFLANGKQDQYFKFILFGSVKKNDVSTKLYEHIPTLLRAALPEAPFKDINKVQKEIVSSHSKKKSKNRGEFRREKILRCAIL